MTHVKHIDGYVLAKRANAGDTEFYVSDDRFKYDFDDRIERATVFATPCRAMGYAEKHKDKLCKSWQSEQNYTILRVIKQPVDTITVSRYNVTEGSGL